MWYIPIEKLSEEINIRGKKALENHSKELKEKNRNAYVIFILLYQIKTHKKRNLFL